jgi:flagellar hook-associated protein 3 FlgL
MYIKSVKKTARDSVNQPSDNPTAAALLVVNNDQASFNTGYLQSLTVVQGQLSTADSTLISVSTALQHALSLGAEAGGGTLSPSDLAAIAAQLQGSRSQLISFSNTAYQGHSLFAGHQYKYSPFVAGTSHSGIAYVGNTDVNRISARVPWQSPEPGDLANHVPQLRQTST